MFETGVGIRNPLFFVGVVENAIDPRHESRVQVRAFGIHGTKNQIDTPDLPWALCVAGNYDTNGLPKLNHWVFGVFLDGRDAQQPLILGTIPTFMSETLDPNKNGWGKHPENSDEKNIDAARPEKVGKPIMNDLGTSEFTEETYVLEQEVNRVKEVVVGQNPNAPNEKFTAWDEPPSAYSAKYPHNRVYESPDGKTCVELDSTPSAERLMIWHRGSYIQVDSNGTRTDKSRGDHYEVNDHNNMVYIGGRSSVTIKGDCHVLVEGNKIEEIAGDLVQVVHGNHILGVGGQLNLNASEEIQMRGAQLRIESNVSGMNLKSAKGLFVETGESMHFKSGIAIFQDATNSINTKAGDNIFIQVGGSYNLKSDTMFLEAAGAGDFKANHAKIGGGNVTSINSSLVYIDDIISLANGDATAPSSADEATAADPSNAAEMPEPPAKSTSVSESNSGSNKPNVSTAGAASVDDSVEDVSENVEESENNNLDSVVPDLSQLPDGVEGMRRKSPTNTQIEAINAAADAAGIPRNLYLRLIAQESNFNPEAGSNKGAYGYAQLMPAAASEVGVDRFDPEENLLGGARYLKKQYDTFGRWDYALAAYNAGPGNMRKYLRESGTIPPFKETQNYVKNILGPGFTVK